MLANTRRAGLGLCLIILAACAGQSTQTANQQTADEIVVTSTQQQEIEPSRSPPSPAPLPVAPGDGRARAAIGGVMGAPYAQTAPQPMPGTVDRDRYDHEDANPIHLVAEDPVSTFSIDVDTAS